MNEEGGESTTPTEIDTAKKGAQENKEAVSQFLTIFAKEPQNSSGPLQGADNYEGIREKWENSGYTKEDIQKYFSEDVLTRLSLEDYILLWRRFPSEVVTHVTRQGIRDHTGLLEHTGGEGAYSEGFMGILKERKLHSSLSKYLSKGLNKKTITEILHLDTFSKGKAQEYLKNLNQNGGAGSYSDCSAVHFAVEEVADQLYGSETGNEIFIVFPSAYIASQKYFNGQLTKAIGGTHNDRWVWTNDGNGMDINAGIVFVPAEAKVDPKTGSRYKLDENNNPIINQENIESLRKIVKDPHFTEFAQEALETLGRISDTDKEKMSKLEPFRQKLIENFRIIDFRLQSAILNYGNLGQLFGLIDMETDSTYDFRFDEAVKNTLSSEGVYYCEADNTISSKEFWEKYFEENPVIRPTKVVYYKGNNPTSVLREWRESSGITKTTESEDLGFSEREISGSEEIIDSKRQEFCSVAQEVIDKYYSEAA